MKPIKLCRQCGHEKQWSEFHRSKSTDDGRADKCRECVIGSLRSYRYAKATRPAPTHCELCGKFSAKQLNYDHDHATNAFRGWLCTGCNTSLGKLGDSIEGLKRAIAYLQGEIAVPIPYVDPPDEGWRKGSPEAPGFYIARLRADDWKLCRSEYWDGRGWSTELPVIEWRKEPGRTVCIP